MKILLHCRPGYSVFLREAVRAERSRNSGVEWSAVCYSNADGMLMHLRELLGASNVLYLQEFLNQRMQKSDFVLDALKALPASLYECIQSTKHTAGIKSLLDKSRDYQIRLVGETYLLYKEFLQRIRPDFVFFSLIEHYDSLVLYHLCTELGITPVIYVQARNVPVSFFSHKLCEELPEYALATTPGPQAAERAEGFVRAFRASFAPPFHIEREPSPDEVIWVKGVRGLTMSRLSRALRRFGSRLCGLSTVGGLVAEPHVVDRYTFALKLKALFLPVTTRARRLRGRLHRRFFDVRSIEHLPEKFVYYPLQLTPEASINVPAPYFVDQLRAIDLLLCNLPADHMLVVKEHPAMTGLRSTAFYKQLRQRAGLLLTDPAVPGREVMKRAALTVSVTGTACFEALLAGRPSLQLGRTFFSEWTDRFDDFYGFRRILRDAMARRYVPMEKAVDLVARLTEIGSDFFLFAPDDPYRKYEHVMNRTNIDKFIDALLLHVQRVQESAAATGTNDQPMRGIAGRTTPVGDPSSQ
ncbi:MAG: hypothetical protein ACJ8LN_13155 [Sulfurifustis sp.]